MDHLGLPDRNSSMTEVGSSSSSKGSVCVCVCDIFKQWSDIEL